MCSARPPLGYVAGVLDSHIVMVAGQSALPLFCRPNDVTRQQARGFVKGCIDKHPESK